VPRSLPLDSPFAIFFYLYFVADALHWHADVKSRAWMKEELRFRSQRVRLNVLLDGSVDKPERSQCRGVCSTRFLTLPEESSRAAGYSYASRTIVLLPQY
jgi:hypothetical protein